MELLGFYDEPYQVAVHHPPKRRRSRPVVVQNAPVRPSLTADSRVSQLWETTEIDESALEWWKPHVVARRKLGGRSVRMSSVGWAAVACVVALSFAWYLIGRPAQMAEESRGVLRHEAATLVATLPNLESVATAVGNREPPDLSETTALVLDAESAARAVFGRAGSLEGMEREAGVGAAATVLEVTARVNRLIAYRLAAEGALIAPDLPSSPGETDLPAATEAVTAWRAEVETAVAELPPGVVPEHLHGLQVWLDGLDEWQARYVDGIRQEDAGAMQQALEELDGQLAGLHDDLLARLEEAGGELVAQLADARSAIEPLLGD